MGDSRNKTYENRPVDIKTEELVAAVLESEEYKEYLEYLAKIKEQPERAITEGAILNFRIWI